MGTTLTGTKPKDTYDSLIKVEDNGPISGTAKYLSDGLGNNLPIAVSTSNVGIGTTAPDTKLQAAGTGATGFSIRANTSGDSFMRYYLDAVIASDAYVDRSTGNLNIRSNQNGSSIVFSTAAALVERVRITDNGLTFNGDTAAANALDDYEEGTWTPVFTMGTSGTITTGGVSGRYTKVGNLVTCTGFANVSSVLLPVGELRIGGLPFTTGTASDSGMSIFAYGFANITAVSTYQGFISAGLTYAIVRGFSNGDQVQNIGANVAASAGIIFTITYRV